MAVIAFENQKDWKAKLESVYSFMLKYSKITVCFMINIENKTMILAAIESSDIGSQPSRNYTSYYTYIDTITCNLVP